MILFGLEIENPIHVESRDEYDNLKVAHRDVGVMSFGVYHSLPYDSTIHTVLVVIPSPYSNPR